MQAVAADEGVHGDSTDSVSWPTVSERLAWGLTLSHEAPWGYGFLDFQHAGHW